MENKDIQAITKENTQEIKLGKVTYRLTSIFTGKKELNKTLEKLAIKKILDNITK